MCEPRVLCYQYGGESESGLGPVGVPGELALCGFRETAPGGAIERFLEDRPKPFSSSDLHSGRRY
jgi:hypothetical protein